MKLRKAWSTSRVPRGTRRRHVNYRFLFLVGLFVMLGNLIVTLRTTVKLTKQTEAGIEVIATNDAPSEDRSLQEGYTGELNTSNGSPRRAISGYISHSHTLQNRQSRPKNLHQRHSRSESLVKIDSLMHSRVFSPKSALFHRNTRVELQLPCDLNAKQGIGISLARLYAVRIVSIITNSKFSFRCKQGGGNLLEMFEVDLAEPEDSSALLMSVASEMKLSGERVMDACANEFPNKMVGCLEVASNFIIQDLQEISQMHNETLGRDDIVIHFRCGNILQYYGNQQGIIPHSFYLDRIEPSSQVNRTIGIVTQSFDSTKGRLVDQEKTKTCQRLVEETVQVLKKKFENDVIVIRNTDPSPILSMMRLVLAKEAVFCGPSAFCGMATLATMAKQGFVYQSHVHNWLLQVANERYFPHLKIVRGPIVAPKEKSIEEILDWMQNPTSSEKSIEQRLTREGSEVECSSLPRIVDSGHWFSDIEGFPWPEFSLMSAWLKPEYPSGLKAPEMRVIPSLHRDAFTMKGRVPIENRYFDQAYLGKRAKAAAWTEALVADKIEKARTRDVPYYGEDAKRLLDGMAKYKARIEGKRAVVIGSESPWVEGGLLLNGAEHVLTLEFGAIESQHPKIDTIVPPKFTESFLNWEIEPFDVGVSFSSLEHDGLGRYGDVMNPIGDLQSMAKMLSVIKPGGLFFLAMPCGQNGRDSLQFNAHRVYGVLRLPLLIAGWRLIDVLHYNPHFGTDEQPLWVLQNMNGCSNKEFHQGIVTKE